MNKPKYADAAFFALPGQHVVALQGRDAVAFAQAQCMNDVAALGDGQWQWSGWLTPKGRLVAMFALLRRDAETLWLLLPDADAGDFAARLQKFLFRSKLQIAVRDDLGVSGAFAAPRTAHGAQAVPTDDGAVELDFSGSAEPRTLRIAPMAAVDDAGQALRWKQADLAHGLPRLPVEAAEQWTPQQLSLDRLRAYSVRKGCYPGQEIVARTHFLGQAKRGLVLLEAEAPIAGESDVREGEDVVGKMVSISGAFGLAVLPLDRRFTDLSMDGVALQDRPLKDGLAR